MRSRLPLAIEKGVYDSTSLAGIEHLPSCVGSKQRDRLFPSSHQTRRERVTTHPSQPNR